MGGPSYQTPYPVKQSDGKEIIWDWNTRDWLPYDRAAAEADKQRVEAHPAGTPDAYGERGPSTYTPPTVPTSAPAPSGPKRVRIEQGRRGGPQPSGAGQSLLTPRGDF